MRNISRRNTLKIIAGAVCLPKLSHANTTMPDGFYVPEESSPHLRTFMQWPVSPIVHPDRRYLGDLQQTIANLANVISDFEPVVMLMDKQYHNAARARLSDRVAIWDIATEDLWARDSGPLFVRNDAGQIGISSLNFNGWGNKQVHHHDGQIARKIAERLNIPLFNHGLVGEPGGIESNGAGVLLANESSWINPNRNPQSRAEITTMMKASYGAQKVIWTPGVMGQDITDDHIDALARFTDANTILIQRPLSHDPTDDFALSAVAAETILHNARNLDGTPFRLVHVNSPKTVRSKQEDFVASYTNYYVCNGAVICAEFGDATADRAAAETLGKLYPEREIISLNIDAIGEIGGGIHCATCQQPEKI